MDVLQIASVTIYSKIINELLAKIEINQYVIGALIFLFFIKNITNTVWFENVINSVFYYVFNKDESTLELSTHEKIYVTGQGKLKRQFYSEYYQALTYYLQHLEEKEMSKFVEVMKINYGNYYDEENGREYMLIPDTNFRTKICRRFQNKNDIYLEVKSKKTLAEKSNDKNDQGFDVANSYYRFILITPGKNNFSVLQRFMNEILDSYNRETQKKKTHSLYEFLRSYNDEDRRDKQTMEYREFPFKSNKYLEKNVFFEGKQDFIPFIDRFCETSDVSRKNYNDMYDISGVTKKACILLYGPPGCGKSCIIKGILNRTGRDGVIVPWSRLKTCSEFCNLFRCQKINDIPFELKNYVFIFEDFDANKSDILKQRKKDAIEMINNKKCGEVEVKKNEQDENITLSSLLSTMSKKTDDDELNLECVLNTLDGIAELQDAVIIFTTNHLEQIDPAFYRSGRVDYLLEMKLASVDIIRQMVQTYCQIDNIDHFKDSFSKMKSYKISTADVQSICFKYGKSDIDGCLKTLVRKTNSRNK